MSRHARLFLPQGHRRTGKARTELICGGETNDPTTNDSEICASHETNQWWTTDTVAQAAFVVRAIYKNAKLHLYKNS